MRYIVCYILLASVLATGCKTSGSAIKQSEVSNVTRPVGCGGVTSHPWLRSFEQLLEGGNLRLRVGVAMPKGTPKADILYLHGFADRMDNHGPLFREWTQQGFRVISFDFPSHGETCGPGSDINKYNFQALAKLANYVESITRENPDRPLLLAGWSTGGLLAVRMVQDDEFVELGRRPRGLVLFAPGVAVQLLVGDWGKVTAESLTRNPAPPHIGPISPKSPILTPIFAKDLLLNSNLAYNQKMPSDIPVLVAIGGELEDKYVQSKNLKKWIEWQRTEQGVKMGAIECPGGYHELDNEPDPMGAQVRAASSEFVNAALNGDSGYVPMIQGPCKGF